MSAPAGPVPAAMRAEIGARLAALEAEEDMQILLAIESGSRAWGFHSADSDYDVRFVYVRPVDWHLRVRPGRDVVERPISADLDISGWDLRKTLGLILNSNAVALEWLQSPVRYREAEGFASALLAFAGGVLRRRPLMWHYLRLAERQRARIATEDGRVRLKPYFYTIRPVLALRWLRLHAGATAAPPMDMGALMAEAAPGAAAAARIAALTEEKRGAEAATTARAAGEVDAMIEAEIAAAQATLAGGRPEPRPGGEAEADRLHAHWTRAFDRVPA